MSCYRRSTPSAVDRPAPLNVRGAWLAAAIFAVHPVNVERGVGDRTQERVVSRLLLRCRTGLSSFCRVGETRKSEPSALVLVALALFAAALLSKTVTVRCGGAAAGVLVEKGRVQRGDVMPLLPFFVWGWRWG